jgi:nucleoside-diphosphate kinase
MIERSLVLIKPDGVQRAIVGEIMSRFERVGLKMIGLKLLQSDDAKAKAHYDNDEAWLRAVGEKQIASAKARGEDTSSMDVMEIGNRVQSYLTNYITLSPVVAIVFEGHGAVKLIRKLVGGTNPADAAPGTIRGDYTLDSYPLADSGNRSLQNLIHASGEVHEAEREIPIWFTPEELHPWKRVDEDLIYRSRK